MEDVLPNPAARRSVSGYFVHYRIPPDLIEAQDQLTEEGETPLSEVVDAERELRRELIEIGFMPEDETWTDNDERWARAASSVDSVGHEWDDGSRLPWDAFLLLPALLDKHLVNLSNSPGAALAFLTRVSAFIDQRWSDDPDADLVDDPFAQVVQLAAISPEWAAPELDGPFRGGTAQVIDQVLEHGEPRCCVVSFELMWLPDVERLSVTLDFDPADESGELMGELAFWALWDWLMLLWRVAEHEERKDGNGDGAVIAGALLRCVARQCAIYRAKGLPQLPDLGTVPYMLLASGDAYAEELQEA